MVFCGGLGVARLEVFEGIAMRHLKAYSTYCVLFVGSVYASMKALEASNVETQIVFRSATPTVVAVLDWAFLGRELPSWKSGMALLAITAGAMAYVLTDSEFVVGGFGAYSWVSLYFILICTLMTLGKQMMSGPNKLESIWSSVLLTNALSLPMLLAFSSVRGEFENIGEAVAETSAGQWAVILGSCVAGTLIGWAGWQCRTLVSATSYTLIGVVNKLLTVVMSVMFLDKHASSEGIMALCLCIAASTQYSQPPLRANAQGSSSESSEPLLPTTTSTSRNGSSSNMNMSSTHVSVNGLVPSKA